MRSDPDAILHLYRRLLAARRASAALQLGNWSRLAAPDDVLAYERRRDADVRVVLVNFSARSVAAPLMGAWRVEVASDGRGEGDPYDGSLGAEQAVVLR
jgi:alpha-glucosidase